MIRFLGLLAFLISFPLISQIRLNGKVINDKDQAISFAHVFIENTGIGTIANQDGDFRLILPNHINEATLTISSIGYDSQKIKITANSKTVVVILRENVLELETVVILPIDYARKLVRAAISNIPNNYPETQELLTVFGRAIVTSDEASEEPFYMIETLTEAIKKSYEVAIESEQVKIVESRKFEFKSIDSLKVRFYGGGHVTHWGDIVQLRKGPLDLNDIDKFDFEITDTLSIGNTILFEVTFDSEKKGRGKILIAKDSYAIAKLEYTQRENEWIDIKEDLISALRPYKRINRKFNVEYHSFDDKWRLVSVHYSSSFINNNDQINLQINDQSIVTNYELYTDNIPYPERLDYRDILLDKVTEYDSTFWKEYNVTLPDHELNAQLINTPLRDPNELSKMEKIMAHLSKTQLKYGLAGISQNTNPGFIDYSNTPSLTESFRIGSNLNFGLKSSIGYELKDNFYLSVEGLQSLKEYVFFGNWINAHYDFNLLKQHRPFYITPIIKLGYINSRQKLTSIYPEKTFSLNDKSFDANKVNIYLETRGISFIPAVALSFEKSSVLRFYVEGGFNLMLTENDGLAFIENENFLKRKKTFISSSSPNLNFTFNEKHLFSNQYMIDFGLVFQI